MDLKGANALITGAAQGMGKVFAAELANAGANVAICDINEEMLQQTAAELIQQTDVKVVSSRVDVSSETEVKSFVSEVESQLGSVDVLVNNAAIHPLHPIEEMPSGPGAGYQPEGIFLFRQSRASGHAPTQVWTNHKHCLRGCKERRNYLWLALRGIEGRSVGLYPKSGKTGRSG